MKKLKDFLLKNNASSDIFDFAKDLTLQEFLNTCDKGNWILWLFENTSYKKNMKLKNQVTLRCFLVCRDLERYSKKENQALDAIKCVDNDGSTLTSFDVQMSIEDNSVNYTERSNLQKITADICRKHLPFEIWNQSKI